MPTIIESPSNMYLRSNRSSPRLLAVGLCVLLCMHKVTCQVISDDSIVFSTMAGWKDMRSCVTCAFGGVSCSSEVLKRAGCETNKCLCKSSLLGEVVKDIGELALSYCSNYDDQKTATSFMLAYCSQKGYTSIGSVVEAPETTGQATETIGAFIATTTVTAVVTVLVSAAPMQRALHHSFVLVSAVMMAVLGSGLWFVKNQRLMGDDFARHHDA
ncbi:hypothetical protein K469DRAFT_710962, partial [Zopfia rhizophila CBS 207.26]